MFRRVDTCNTPRHKLLTIELSDVVREYRVGGQSVRALDGITLRLEGGQFMSVVGPSGAGKSTLLHLLGALDSPDSGSIQFDGDEIGRLTDEQQSEFRHHRVGFIFQFFNLLPTLSAWENVAVPKLLDGVRMGKAKPDAIRLLERVGLGNRTEHRPSELSGGQMQRVAVARALMMDPPLILADEPTGNLDSTTGASILALLGEVAHEPGRGRLVVMVTHNFDAAAATDWREFLDADRAFHLITLEESGNVILSGFYSSLRDRQMRMIRESAQRDPNRMTTIMAEHRAIAEALRDADLERALQAIRTHLASTSRAIGIAVEPFSLEP